SNATLSAAIAGIYKVQVKVDNCVSAFSSDTPLIVTGDIERASTEIAVYPNPVDDYLMISGLPTETTECMVTDMTGRTTTLKLERQNGVHRADVKNYGTGLYLARVQTGNEVHQIKFIKK
ncbi:MAG TPA: T9SS type A sorting domain-containing protein, partial [Cyclobacteriaceae bacterium]|nr:T9SS type A sorting domain-containing protein [Cyclobacteriaceae bacterium]